ncbi:MAG: hypothetical protein EOO73_25825 [Myxococcales bacterium]|nr:MAG: hypothetical protein EOO73_25825 [Myxococcales bacterium]
MIHLPKAYPLLAAGLALLGSCSDAGPRVYTAQPYDSESQCLGEYESVGLVEADTLSAACGAVCLEITGSLFVSTVCPPYPDTATVVDPAESETCGAALEAASCE